jgi:hypothetical protein
MRRRSPLPRPKTHFQQVPLKIAEKILEKQIKQKEKTEPRSSTRTENLSSRSSNGQRPKAVPGD